MFTTVLTDEVLSVSTLIDIECAVVFFFVLLPCYADEVSIAAQRLQAGEAVICCYCICPTGLT